MSSDRNRAIAIFAVVGVIAFGSAFYYVKIYAPKQAKAAARAEFSKWDGAWNNALQCMLGDTPASAKLGEALAIHELEQRADIGDCTKLVAHLSRPAGKNTGIMEVEKLWSQLDAATSRVANLFAEHVSHGSSWRQDALPAALDRAMEIRAQLASAVDYDDRKPPSIAPLPVAQLVPLDPNVTSIRSAPYLVSAGGAMYFGTRGDQEVQLELAPGAAPKIEAVTDVIRAVPDTTWGARVTDGTVEIGSVDAAGVLTVTSKFPIKGVEATAAIVGTPQAGLVVAGGPETLVIIRGKDGTWVADKPIQTVRVTGEHDLDGRTLMVWTDPKQVSHAAMLQPGQPDVSVEVGGEPESMDQLCLTRDHGWLNAGGQLIGMSTGLPIRDGSSATIIGCTPDAVLATTPSGFWICTDSCRDAASIDRDQSSARTVIGGKLVEITSHGGIVRVSREGAKPSYLSLPEEVIVLDGMAWTNGTVIDVLARTTKDTFTLIRIRAS